MFGKKLLVGLVVAAMALVLSLSALAADRTYIYSMDNEDEVYGFDSDNTGAEFAYVTDMTAQGTGASQVTPSGDSAETKLALDLDGKNLEAWSEANWAVLSVYVPKGMAPAINKFFLGMADVTSGWAWTDGVFADVKEVKEGWNEIRYPVTALMKDTKTNGHYKLYFSFFCQNADGTKPPLTQAFFIDGLGVEK